MKTTEFASLACIRLALMLNEGVGSFAEPSLSASSFRIHIEVLPAIGFRAFLPPATYPSGAEIRFFGFHSNVNAAIRVPDAGRYEGVVTKADSDANWVFETRSVKLNVGDVINYWAYIEANESAYKIDLRTYIVEDGGLCLACV